MTMKWIDRKLVKFIIVGVLNTALGMIIMFGLYNWVGLSYWISSAANYIFVSIFSFVLNKKFTFQHKGKIVQSGLRFAVNIAACYLLAYGIAKPCVLAVMEGCSKNIQENVAMVVGMCLFTGFNYLGQRCFVFRERK